uniref:Uncharacterized protein n=1 Tax=Micrurus surinamensis TaxID=129470 RepID=A0A2D4NL38_MICSU
MRIKNRNWAVLLPIICKQLDPFSAENQPQKIYSERFQYSKKKGNIIHLFQVHRVYHMGNVFKKESRNKTHLAERGKNIIVMLRVMGDKSSQPPNRLEPLFSQILTNPIKTRATALIAFFFK